MRVPIDAAVLKQLSDDLRRQMEEKPIAGTCSARMPFAQLAYCGRRVVEGAEFCYWHLQDTAKYSSDVLARYFGRQTTLAEVLEEEVASGRSLEFAFLKDCRLGGSFLKPGPNLTGARFICANLNGAWMGESNLNYAILAGADLTKAKLSSCSLVSTNFANARLFEVKLRSNDLATVSELYRRNFRGVGKFGVPVERILEEYPEQAAPMYSALVSYFSSRGLFEDASWAAYRASLMRHRIFRQEMRLVSIKGKRWA